MDPTSFQGHLDWLVLWDPAYPPTEEDEGRALHLYFDRPVLESYHTHLALQPDDATRLGSAAWTAHRLEAERVEEPSLEVAGRLRAYDRAAQAYASEPPFLVQLRRYQMRLLAVLNDWGVVCRLEPPPYEDLGIETYALMVSNGHTGRREMLAPVLQVTPMLFEGLASAMHGGSDDTQGLFADFAGEGTWDERSLPVLIEHLGRAMKAAGDPLVQATLCAAHCAASAAHEFGWVLIAEGPEEAEPFFLPGANGAPA